MQDYGGPVGLRMAMAHPQRLDSLIVQNAVPTTSGLVVSGTFAGILGGPRQP